MYGEPLMALSRDQYFNICQGFSQGIRKLLWTVEHFDFIKQNANEVYGNLCALASVWGHRQSMPIKPNVVEKIQEVLLLHLLHCEHAKNIAEYESLIKNEKGHTARMHAETCEAMLVIKSNGSTDVANIAYQQYTDNDLPKLTWQYFYSPTQKRVDCVPPPTPYIALRAMIQAESIRDTPSVTEYEKILTSTFEHAQEKIVALFAKLTTPVDDDETNWPERGMWVAAFAKEYYAKGMTGLTQYVGITLDLNVTDFNRYRTIMYQISSYPPSICLTFRMPFSWVVEHAKLLHLIVKHASINVYNLEIIAHDMISLTE